MTRQRLITGRTGTGTSLFCMILFFSIFPPPIITALSIHATSNNGNNLPLSHRRETSHLDDFNFSIPQCAQTACDSALNVMLSGLQDCISIQTKQQATECFCRKMGKDGLAGFLQTCLYTGNECSDDVKKQTYDENVGLCNGVKEDDETYYSTLTLSNGTIMTTAINPTGTVETATGTPIVTEVATSSTGSSSPTGKSENDSGTMFASTGPTTEEQNKQHTQLSVPVIVGVAVGGTGLLGLFVGIFYLIRYCRRKERKSGGKHNGESPYRRKGITNPANSSPKSDNTTGTIEKQMLKFDRWKVHQTGGRQYNVRRLHDGVREDPISIASTIKLFNPNRIRGRNHNASVSSLGVVQESLDIRHQHHPVSPLAKLNEGRNAGIKNGRVLLSGHHFATGLANDSYEAVYRAYQFHQNNPSPTVLTPAQRSQSQLQLQSQPQPQPQVSSVSRNSSTSSNSTSTLSGEAFGLYPTCYRELVEKYEVQEKLERERDLQRKKEEEERERRLNRDSFASSSALPPPTSWPSSYYSTTSSPSIQQNSIVIPNSQSRPQRNEFQSFDFGFEDIDQRILQSQSQSHIPRPHPISRRNTSASASTSVFVRSAFQASTYSLTPSVTHKTVTPPTTPNLAGWRGGENYCDMVGLGVYGGDGSDGNDRSRNGRKKEKDGGAAINWDEAGCRSGVVVI